MSPHSATAHASLTERMALEMSRNIIKAIEHARANRQRCTVIFHRANQGDPMAFLSSFADAINTMEEPPLSWAPCPVNGNPNDPRAVTCAIMVSL